jgi:DNA-binding LacI/PurR family transcriptional regulator
MRRGRRTIERRFEGWQDALRERGLAAGDLAVEVADWLPDLAAEAIARRIEARGLDFTAVLAAGDSLAIGAMMAIRKSGYEVPADVSVMGMDDADLGGDLPPRRIEFACHIVQRQSTGPVRA